MILTSYEPKAYGSFLGRGVRSPNWDAVWSIQYSPLQVRTNISFLNNYLTGNETGTTNVLTHPVLLHICDYNSKTTVLTQILNAGYEL